MLHLIKDNQAIENDPWSVFSGDANESLPQYALLPVNMWIEMHPELKEFDSIYGVVLYEGDSISTLEPYLNHISIIGFNFSKFADGRAFSMARKLRGPLNFNGEIRAIGDFMPDQVGFLERSGFNSFSCRTAQERDTALNISRNISVKYQSDAIEKKPLFRRR